MSLQIFLDYLAVVHTANGACCVNHPVRTPRTFHIVWIFQIQFVGRQLGCLAALLFSRVGHCLRLSQRIVLEWLGSWCLGILGLLDLRQVGLGSFSMRVLILFSSWVLTLALVHIFKSSVRRFAVAHTFACPRMVTHVLLLRRRYITDVAQELGLVLVRLVAHLRFVCVVAITVTDIEILGHTIRLRIIMRFGNCQLIACTTVLVYINWLDLLFLGIQRHLPYFLWLIIHFLFQNFLLLFHCITILIWDLIFNIVIVQFFINRPPHRYFVIKIIFNIDTAFNTSPIRIP